MKVNYIINVKVVIAIILIIVGIIMTILFSLGLINPASSTIEISNEIKITGASAGVVFVILGFIMLYRISVKQKVGDDTEIIGYKKD